MINFFEIYKYSLNAKAEVIVVMLFVQKFHKAYDKHLQ